MKRLPFGPVDNQTVVGNDWYNLLVHADPDTCAALSAAASPDKNGLSPFGAELYFAAAAACLGHWDQAAKAFTGQVRPTVTTDACGKPLVFDWVQTLLDRHRADPSFVPVFEDATPGPACPSAAPPTT